MISHKTAHKILTSVILCVLFSYLTVDAGNASKKLGGNVKTRMEADI